MMTKKDFKVFADGLGFITNEEDREKLINFLIPYFGQINNRFDESRFREWINRRIKGESTKGLG